MGCSDLHAIKLLLTSLHMAVPPTRRWDNFEGSSLDRNKWSYDLGNGEWGWGNNELQVRSRCCCAFCSCQLAGSWHRQCPTSFAGQVAVWCRRVCLDNLCIRLESGCAVAATCRRPTQTMWPMCGWQAATCTLLPSRCVQVGLAVVGVSQQKPEGWGCSVRCINLHVRSCKWPTSAIHGLLPCLLSRHSLLHAPVLQDGNSYTSGRINTKQHASFYPGMQVRQGRGVRLMPWLPLHA